MIFVTFRFRSPRIHQVSLLIGGAAALLAYKATRLTQDIDSFNKITVLEIACKKAKEDTGLKTPLSPAGAADGPYCFKD